MGVGRLPPHRLRHGLLLEVVGLRRWRKSVQQRLKVSGIARIIDGGERSLQVSVTEWDIVQLLTGVSGLHDPVSGGVVIVEVLLVGEPRHLLAEETLNWRVHFRLLGLTSDFDAGLNGKFQLLLED